MKKRQAPKVLDKVLADFSERIAFLRFDSFTAQKNFKDPHNLQINIRNKREKIISNIEFYIKTSNGEPEIWVIEEKNINKGTYHFIDKPFHDLMENLSSHACLLYSCAVDHFGHAPHWERKNKRER